MALLGSCLPAQSPALERDADVALAAFADGGPGVVVSVAQGDRVVYSAARGMASLTPKSPMTRHTALRIGSLTKTMTAAAILVLRDRGTVRLDAPLSTWLPDFPRSRDITLAQLLSHTAGVSDAWDAPLTERLDTSRRLALIGSAPLDFDPGTSWAYSNSGYMLLGVVLEKVTGKPWNAAIRDLVLSPLGLNETAYWPDDAVVPGLASGYVIDGDGPPKLPVAYSISGPGAAGGLTSTADDVSRFVRRLMEGRLLAAATVATMTKPTRIGEDEAPYGEGVMLGTVHGQPVVEHNGAIDGYRAHYVYVPGRDVTVVVLENCEGGPLNARSLAHRLAASAIGQPYRVLVDAKLDASTLAPVAGTYDIDGRSRHNVTVEHGVVTIRRGDEPKKRLVAAAGDILFYPDDGIDFFHVVRENGAVVALEFHGDGQDDARVEKRVEGAR